LAAKQIRQAIKESKVRTLPSTKFAHRNSNNAWYAEQLGVSTRTVRTCLYERQKFYFHVHDGASGPEKVKFLRTMRFQDEHFRGRIKSVEQIVKPGLRISFVSISHRRLLDENGSNNS
jgi:hypothetical protein